MAITSAEAPVRRAANFRAVHNWAVNLRALSITQPGQVQASQRLATGLEWLFARDGYLTGRIGGAWWSGCSLPLRAAQYMMRTLDVGGSMACVLNPAHAAQVRVVLDLLKRPQGIIVLMPDEQSFHMLLACDDFSMEIAEHRLWFAAGAAWETQLRRLLEQTPGLPTPTQFVRPVAADNSATDGLVGPAQKVFAEINARRAAAVREMVRAKKSPPAHRFCIIAPSFFRLWDDAGAVLAAAFAQETQGSTFTTARFDPDDPASASPLALAKAASACDVLAAANTGRSDLPEVAPLQMPWITWVTCPRVPSAQGRGPHDSLVIVNESLRPLALSGGWPDDKITVGAWPANEVKTGGLTASATIAMIVDLPALAPPPCVAEYSSQAQLWDEIADELLNRPFALQNVEAFLDERMRRRDIRAEGFDRGVFVGGLIIPSFQRGVARMLVQCGPSIRCHGSGWADCAEFAPIAAGPVESRAELLAIANNSAALVHGWPAEHPHPIESLGRPVIRAYGKSRESFLREAKLAAAGKSSPPSPAQPLVHQAILSVRLHSNQSPDL